jgi:predicted phage baseplate assembly protein
MPLPVPSIDTRTYQQLVDETLARVPTHTPEWTNFNSSDPGVTIVQLFAFLAEAMIYRANQIPVRNRAKFLDLLGIPLRTASEARGLATIANERGPLEVETLTTNLELLAGAIPFRTQLGLDVLPVETRLVVKRSAAPDADVEAYYRLLYASYETAFPDDFALYESVQLDPARDMIDLSTTTDRS